ncbi:MAG: sigma-70 family RNA polymerase sigma factor [Wenzhouxiangella sp.]|nr:MAG: sigma-70 family RNA polymerase sigma factor [Wenzhouxiangella sp.]
MDANLAPAAQAACQRDADWVESARGGCQQSFQALYQNHAGRLMPMLWRMSGGDSGRAQDWLQEAFLKAWRHLDQLDDPLRFGAWLKRLTVNLALADRRRAQLATVSEGMELQAAPAPPWPAADQDLERAIAALPERARQVLVLFCLEGFTHAEIAECMAIDEGTSKGQLHRARQILKDALS